MTRNKLLSKYNIYEEVDELAVMNDTKNKSIDQVFALGDDSSKNLFSDVKVKSLALFPPDDTHFTSKHQEVKSEMQENQFEDDVKETYVLRRKEDQQDLLGLKSLYTNKSTLH